MERVAWISHQSLSLEGDFNSLIPYAVHHPHSLGRQSLSRFCQWTEPSQSEASDTRVEQWHLCLGLPGGEKLCKKHSLGALSRWWMLTAAFREWQASRTLDACPGNSTFIFPGLSKGIFHPRWSYISIFVRGEQRGLKWWHQGKDCQCKGRQHFSFPSTPSNSSTPGTTWVGSKRKLLLHSPAKHSEGRGSAVSKQGQVPSSLSH